MTVRCLPVLTLILLSGCGSTPSGHPAGSFDEARIREAIDRAVGAFGTSDIETLISLRTEDSVVLKPGAEPLLGKEARRASLLDVFDRFDVDETRTVEEIDVVGDRAIVWGTYTVTLTPRTPPRLRTNPATTSTSFTGSPTAPGSLLVRFGTPHR